MILNDRYEVHDRLGEGGMALVYRATDLRLGRDVAVKMLRPQYASDADFVARFEQEAQAAARLNHPNIAAVFDTGEDGEIRYIVMERLKPFTLHDLLLRSPDRRLSTPDAARYGAQIARALAHAHQQGIVHRDIKPHNVLFTDDGLVKVTDFGIARALAATGGTATGTILGSPNYLSPEQAAGESAGPASDVYSLGVVLYELVTGQPPYAGETPVAIALQHVRGQARRPRELVPSLPAAMEQVIVRAMAREPAERFATAKELAESLERVESGAPLSMDRTTVMPRVAARPAAAVSAPALDEAEPPRTDYRRLTTPPGRNPAVTVGVTLLIVGCLAAGAFFGIKAANPDRGDHGQVESPPAPVNPVLMMDVPDLVGQDVDAARQRLEQIYSSQRVEPPQIVEVAREDNAAPRNQVLRQEPHAGSKIPQGGVVKVWVSSGVESVGVPDLVGRPLDEARQRLVDQGFLIGNVDKVYDDTNDPDVVLSQSATPGTMLRRGSTVDLRVSRGPEPPPPDEPTTPPPDEGTGGGGGGPAPTISHSKPGPPADGEGGLKVARIVVSVPDGSPERSVELRWLKGGTGSAGGGSVKPGGMYTEDVRGTDGAVLGVYVDGELKDQVEY